MIKLVVISKNVTAAPLELGEGWATVGRADGNTLQIIEPSISGRHCEVQRRGEELLVRDLLSTNGTFVGGQKISEAVLQAGQTLRLGDVELRTENSAPSGGTSFISKMLMTSSATATRPPAPTKTVPAEKSGAQMNSAVAKKFRVLFVDDSLAFLEAFGGVCAEHSQQTWEVLTATSADQALATLKTKPVDLAVLDIGMPMLDGLQLLGLITRRHPGLKLAVMTGKATPANRADALANGADLFLEKPLTSDGMKSVFNMLNELVSWSALEGFTGAVRNVGLQEVVQMECNGRHSSILEIRDREWRGQIFIEAGVITHAAVGQLTGEQAFYKLMSLRGGQFQVLPFTAPPQRTIEGRWEFLLMDAARATDEETVLVKKISAPVVAASVFTHGEDIVEVAH
jgi:CheY-like chemotaxis protein